MYKINPKILRTPTVNGNILLLEPEEGLYFELNETSVIIYQSIVDGLTKVDIVQRIVDNYQIESVEAEKDVSALIEQLLDNNIIRI
jgi:hypothetical protein